MDLTLEEERITTFKQALERVSALAHAKLPAELHGNLERATALVLGRHVWMDEDGKHAQVLSSDGATFYLVNGNCTCMGVAHAPQALCKHRLAVGLYRRASEVLTSAAARPHPAAAEKPCPEALFSACFKGTVRGIETQLTARGQTLEEFQRHFDAVHALFDAPAARPASETPEQGQAPGEPPVCPHHGKNKESTKAKGTFFCPAKMADGTYCQWRHPAK